MKVTIVSESRGQITATDSFLLEAAGKHILFDCGFDIFAKLLKLPNVIRSLDAIFISQMNDRSMGSLKSLLQYRYKTYKSSTAVLASGAVRDWLLNFLSDRGMWGISKRKVQWATIVPVISFSSLVPDLDLYSVKGWSNTPTYGLYAVEHTDSRVSVVGISGPTRSVQDFEQVYNMIMKLAKQPVFELLLHDLGGAKNPAMAIRAYPDELPFIYSEVFISKLRFYGTLKSLGGTQFVL